MKEFQFAFQSMPRLMFAHRFSTTVYDIKHPSDSIIELSYIQQGEWMMECDGHTYTAPADSAIVSVYDRPHHFHSSGYHQHVTAGFLIDYQLVSSGGLVLPRIFRFESADNPLLPLLEQLALQFTVDPSSPQNIALLWCALGTLSQIYLTERIQKQNFGQAWYVERAKRYIAQNLSHPLRIAEIASSLDISAGYLSHLFTEETGQTISQYINTLRIRRVEELVLTQGMNIREASAQAGLHDPNYASRLYRRMRGFSLSEMKHSCLIDPAIRIPLQKQ